MNKKIAGLSAGLSLVALVNCATTKEPEVNIFSLTEKLTQRQVCFGIAKLPPVPNKEKAVALAMQQAMQDYFSNCKQESDYLLYVGGNNFQVGPLVLKYDSLNQQIIAYDPTD